MKHEEPTEGPLTKGVAVCALCNGHGRRFSYSREAALAADPQSRHCANDKVSWRWSIPCPCRQPGVPITAKEHRGPEVWIR